MSTNSCCSPNDIQPEQLHVAIIGVVQGPLPVLLKQQKAEQELLSLNEPM